MPHALVAVCRILVTKFVIECAFTLPNQQRRPRRCEISGSSYWQGWEVCTHCIYMMYSTHAALLMLLKPTVYVYGLHPPCTPYGIYDLCNTLFVHNSCSNPSHFYSLHYGLRFKLNLRE